MLLPTQASGPKLVFNGHRIQPIDSPRHVDTVRARIQKLLALERAQADAYFAHQLELRRLAEAPNPAVTATVRNLLAWICEPATHRVALAAERLGSILPGSLDTHNAVRLARVVSGLERTRLWAGSIDPSLRGAMAVPSLTELMDPTPDIPAIAVVTPGPDLVLTAALPKPVERLQPDAPAARISITSLMPLDFEKNVLFNDLAREKAPDSALAVASDTRPEITRRAPEVVDAVEVVAYEPDPETGAAPAILTASADDSLPVAEPAGTSLLREVTEAPLTAAVEAPAANPLADIAAPTNAISDIAAEPITLASVARERGFLNEAWISYDEAGQKWEAKWPKPPMFHYGSVLLPVLASRMQAGQSVNFEIQGRPARITKREDGQLMVARGGDARLVNANDIKGLLQSKIESEGMLLFLDRQGNLVLQATGSQAVAMAHLSKNAM